MLISQVLPNFFLITSLHILTTSSPVWWPPPSPPSEISGQLFDSTFPLYYLLSLVLLLSPVTLSVIFLRAGPFSWTFFRKILQYFSLRDRDFCMAPFQQLGDVSWSVVCAACCHMALVFAVKHLHTVWKMLLLLSSTFLLFKKIFYW